MAVDVFFHVLVVLCVIWLTFLYLSSKRRFSQLEGSFFKRDGESKVKLEALETRITQTLSEITSAHEEQLNRSHAKKPKRKSKLNKSHAKKAKRSSGLNKAS